ncbi:MAG: AbrB/MazE/SpoVT family DNA-binding domain-containing protein [Phycisphaeraceae bacterium]
MLKKLSKHGDSFALVIEKPILDLLGIDENTSLNVTTNGRSITFEPADAAQRASDLERFLEDTNDRYGEVLKRLAE